MNADRKKQEVQDADDRRVRALLAKDYGAFAALLSDALVYHHASGKVDTKASYLAQFLDGKVAFVGIERKDVNIDMIGRMDVKHKEPNYTYVIGSDRLSTELHAINENANKTYTHLDLDYTYNADDDPNRFYYRSDHYNFAKNGIPAIFYFSGVHED